MFCGERVSMFRSVSSSSRESASATAAASAAVGCGRVVNNSFAKNLVLWGISIVALLCWLVEGHQGHGQGRPSEGQGFHDSKVVRDAEHINEHLQGQAAINVSQMSPEELEFYYFKLHDTDNNTKLDGLEIFKALVHMLPQEEIDTYVNNRVDARGKSPEEVKNERKDEELGYYTAIVDNVMRADDIDDDGYLTYPEFIVARRREDGEHQQRQQQQQQQQQQQH